MTEPISVVCWIYGRAYTWTHVTRLKNMVARHLTVPHEFHVIDPTKMHEMATALGFLPIPSRRNLRRIMLFSAEAERWFGRRIFQIDLDMVITGNIDHLITDDLFKIWKSGSTGAHGHAYNPSLMYMRAGALNEAWKEAKDDPVAALERARANGWTGSDQAIIANFIHPYSVTYGREDGIYSWRDDDVRGLPSDARVVSFHGVGIDQRKLAPKIGWIKREWR